MDVNKALWPLPFYGSYKINIKLRYACAIKKAYIIDIQAKLFTSSGLTLAIRNAVLLDDCKDCV